MLIAEPYGGDGMQAYWARQRLRGQVLVNQQVGPVSVLSIAEADDDSVFAAYTKSARAWTSVTPVVLPGFDDGKYNKALRLVRKAIEQAGLRPEAIEDIELRPAPFWPGAQHAAAYFRPEYLRGQPAWHVRLQFYDEVPGPLAIGAGRHFGLGLFAALPE